MKDGIVFFFVCVVLITGLSMWASHVDPFHPFRSSIPYVQPPAPDLEGRRAPVLTAERTKPAPKPARAREPEEPVVAEIVKATRVERAVPVVVAGRQHFPSVDQIAVGSEKPRITDAFGDPTLSAMTSRGGHVIETYVYARDRGRAVTVISFEDGKVSSTYSTPDRRSRPAGADSSALQR